VTFKKPDWEKFTQGITRAEEHLQAFQVDKNQPAHLDDAVCALWRFAEYAMNAGLEMIGERTDRGHELGKTAEVLFTAGHLQEDHSQVLDQLEKYRRKAEYGSYSRDKSVHYSSADVRTCLAVIHKIRIDLEDLLKKHRKLQ
jgi:hypothetical protein